MPTKSKHLNNARMCRHQKRTGNEAGKPRRSPAQQAARDAQIAAERERIARRE